MTWMMQIGKATHFHGRSGRTACGVQSTMQTGDRALVDCIRCLKTEKYRGKVKPVPKELPELFELWNPALRGAYLRGYRDSRNGVPVGECPYRDTRKRDGRLTWSRSFVRAWEDGFRHAKLEAKGEGQCVVG